jgi:type IV pilus assembly protein PilC
MRAWCRRGARREGRARARPNTGAAAVSRMKGAAGFFRTLADLHRAGIPWPRAVESAGGDDPRTAHAVSLLSRGAPVDQALAGWADPIDLAMIKAGGEGGTLEATLRSIAEGHEARHRETQRRLTSFAYPLFLAHVSAVLLPLPDLIQGRTGAALGWAAVVLVPLYGSILYLGWMRRRARVARAAPRPPRLARLFPSRVEEADARALDALGRLYEAGVPLSEALPLAQAVGTGGRVAVDLETARDRVRQGLDLAGAWRTIPPELAARLASAEEAGMLGAAMQRVAGYLSAAAEERRKRVGATLPAAVVLLLGALIAWRVFSFYSGYYSSLPR